MSVAASRLARGYKNALNTEVTSRIWACCRRASSGGSLSVAEILNSVKLGSLNIQDAEKLLISQAASQTAVTSTTTRDTLQSFANLDHTRSLRTGFPEVVFAENKTPQQVAMILDDMARNVNETIQQQLASSSSRDESKKFFEEFSTSILATRYVAKLSGRYTNRSRWK